MKKRLFYAAVAALLLLSLVSCGRDGLPPDESSGGPVPNSSAEVTWEAPDETLSASLAKLLSKHSSKGWYHHIGKADVFRQDGVVRAEITLKEESTKYASASVMLSGFFDTEQMDAFFPGLCGAAEELGFRSADVAEIGKLFYNLTTQDDAQNYARIAGYGLPVYQLLADITGEKVSKIKADIDSRIVDDAKVAQVRFMALEDTYAEKSKEITQAEMTQISGVILTEFQDAAVGKVVFIDPNGTVIREIG